jgi:tetratricopeptide (TPR) repeat protein
MAKIFCWSSERDSDVRLLDQLLLHLQVRNWYNAEDIFTYRNIQGGHNRQEKLTEHLATADIVLPLISPDFPWNSEAEQQLKLRKDNHEVLLIIPVMLRPIMLPRDAKTFFAELPLVLPARDRAIIDDRWNKHDALLFVTGHLDPLVSDFIDAMQEPQISPKDRFVRRVKALIAKNDYIAVLRYCETMAHNSPKEAYIYQEKGDAHCMIGEVPLALEAYTHALELAPNDIDLWRKKGSLLKNMKLFKDARQAYEQAISFSPPNTYLYKELADILLELHLYQDAITAYDQAIKLESYKAAYIGRAIAREKLAEQLLQQAKEDRQRARKL